MKRFLLFLPLASVICAGCAATSMPAPAPSMRGLAASFAAGRAFDRASAALKSDDDRALQSAGKRYARASARIDDKGVLLGAVAMVSAAAMQLEDAAKSAPPKQREALLKRALDKYRAASDFLPANPKSDGANANALNMIGYPLADRGTTRADWERAAQLTKLSLAQWDKDIRALPPDSPQRLNFRAARTLGALDSYAWSLFRLGRIEEAVTQQEQVIEFARKNPVIINNDQYAAEKPYHMAEIYRAAGREADAQEQYKTALDLRPDAELAQRINIALNDARV